MYPGGTDVRQMYLFSWLKEVNHRKVKFPTPWIWYMHVWKCSHMKLYFVVSHFQTSYLKFLKTDIITEGETEYDSGRIAIKYAISHNLNRNLFTEVINQVRSQFLIGFCKIRLFFCINFAKSNALCYLFTCYITFALLYNIGLGCNVT